MEKWVNSWHSQRLQKEMPVAVYGHYGFALLLVPTVAADFLEYERFQLINAISHFIDSRKVKIFSINSINNESWMNGQVEPRMKIIRHQQSLNGPSKHSLAYSTFTTTTKTIFCFSRFHI